MRAYIIRRLLLSIVTLLMVTVIVFFSVRLIPGDVVQLMVQEHSYLQAQDVEAIRHKLGLDVPMHIQYGRWVWGIISRGDLGSSLWGGPPVTEQIRNRLPVSFELGIMAMLIGLIIALPIGIYSAMRQDSVGDYIGRSFAIACIALPSFWLGTMATVFPSVWWYWSPPVSYIPFSENPTGNLGQFVLPGAILGMVLSGTTMRMTRTMMLEVLRQDYIRTAWAKGLKERVVITRHALKNALIPVVTVVGLQLPVVFGGSVILENIFCLPGIGALMVDIINTRDYLVLSGINLFMASIMLMINLGVDLTYGFLDPRVHY